jgi:hypothetical protein
MWKLNNLSFSTVQELKNFIASNGAEFVDNLSPFIIEITAGEGESAVRARLNSKRTIWWDNNMLSDVDWETTYTTPHGQQDRDPLPVQKLLLDELHEIQSLFNRLLNS